MARPRRGFLFELDATGPRSKDCASSVKARAEFYGLQVANRLRVEKITVYRSLRRLTSVGLVDRWWEDQEVASREGRPRRRLYALNQHGKDALPYALRARDRALGRQYAAGLQPDASNSVTPRRSASRPLEVRDRVLVGREVVVGAEELVGARASADACERQLCLAAKLTIWKYTVSTFCEYPGSVAQLPLPITFQVGVRPLAKNVS